MKQTPEVSGCIKIDEFLLGGFTEYDQNVSDHRPVGLKLFIDSGLSTSEFNTAEIGFKNYPNPFNTETNFTFNSSLAVTTLDIFNLKGQKIASLKVPEGLSSISLNAQNLYNGIFIAKLMSGNTVLANRKIVVIN